MERWSCGFDIPDAGDVERMTVRDCQAIDCWQDGFHLDGSWDGHRQRAVDVLFERCRAQACGWRSGTGPAELYQSGFYVQSARLVDCVAGALPQGRLPLQERGGRRARPRETARTPARPTPSSSSTAGTGAKVEGFVSDGATRRALQMVGNDAEVEVEIRNFAGDGRPVLLGITERLEFVDAPGHVEDLKRYRARGYAMKGNRISIS